MPDFASALHARLTGDADVAALVDTRVYWVNRPQNSPLPAIRLQTISDPRPEHLGGYDAARVTRVQADCFAQAKADGTGGYKQARALAEKVIAAVAAPATVGGVVFGHTKAEGPHDLGEDTAAGFIHRASVDLLVEHRLA